MANTTPIDTQTKVKRIVLEGNVEQKIRAECDGMGALGYELKAAFQNKVENKENLFLIFQLTR